MVMKSSTPTRQNLQWVQSAAGALKLWVKRFPFRLCVWCAQTLIISGRYTQKLPAPAGGGHVYNSNRPVRS
jgi:hypothetical protein